ncbi:GGDEF domain-containing protein [Alishewanella longhuensis]|uniref:diguanylate cyclase n=1 Tax=Alishewanella longhuensis TaxID=1091037 RepID=A0ABQ3L172_9ALTE|nr:GGDEF domain-containing protein [Alishewanella longhuensis]GHG70199.1 GGDEF domain-containing protein [Alishewanella longhuensis]
MFNRGTLLERLGNKLKQDFYLAMITLVGAIIASFVTPYAIYRLYTGNLVVGIADLIIVISAISAVIYAWRTGDTVKPGQFLALIFCIGAGIVCISLGINGLFWVYPLLVFIFFLVSARRAVILSLMLLFTLAMVDLAWPSLIFVNHYQMTSFLVTSFVCSFFAYVFAYRAQLQRNELKQLASIDSLTGAGNRHTLNQELEQAVLLKQKLQSRFAVILFDLDFFKQINDNYGHKVGDETLIRLVPIISGMIRQTDQVFRFGGEEFLVLLRDMDTQNLLPLAEKIRSGVEQKLRLPDGKAVTLSAGVAILEENEHWEQWLHRADMALYQAKHNGRNQVIAAA